MTEQEQIERALKVVNRIDALTLQSGPASELIPTPVETVCLCTAVRALGAVKGYCEALLAFADEYECQSAEKDRHILTRILRIATGEEKP